MYPFTSRATEKYHRLCNDEIEQREYTDENGKRDQSQAEATGLKLAVVLGAVALILSLILNFFILTQGYATHKEEKVPSTVGISKFAGLRTTIETPIYMSTEYGPAIGTSEDRDRLWAAIDISPGVLAFPDTYARMHGLPRSQRFPWDQEQGVYLLGAYHSIHCLKQIQKMTSQYAQGVEITVPHRHVEHCLDTLLQDVYCQADDTPWYQLPPQPYAAEYDEYQTRTCRNWDELMHWTQNFNACFRYENVTMPEGLSDQERQLEHYRFCPEDSPHKQKMEKYFEKLERKLKHGESRSSESQE